MITYACNTDGIEMVEVTVNVKVLFSSTVTEYCLLILPESVCGRQIIDDIQSFLEM